MKCPPMDFSFFFFFFVTKRQLFEKGTWSLTVGCQQAPIRPAACMCHKLHAKPLNL